MQGVRTDLYYFDTSALTKALVEESGTDTIRALLESIERHAAYVSAVQQVELRSAIVMRLSRRELTDERADQAFQAIDALLLMMRVVPVSEAILSDASETIRDTRLRALDAIQLATALDIRRVTDSPLTFVAADRRLLEAAQASGLSILNPEQPLEL